MTSGGSMTELDAAAASRGDAPAGVARETPARADQPRIPTQRGSGSVPTRPTDRYLLRLVAVDATAAAVAPLAAGVPVVAGLVHGGGALAPLAYLVTLPVVWVLSVALVRGYER